MAVYQLGLTTFSRSEASLYVAALLTSCQEAGDRRGLVLALSFALVAGNERGYLLPGHFVFTLKVHLHNFLNE